MSIGQLSPVSTGQTVTHVAGRYRIGVRLASESVFGLRRNGCSACAGIGVRHGPVHATMTGADWQRILRIMDTAFADYLTGMAAVRERVTADLKRKLTESKVPDHPELLFAVNLHGFLRCTPFDGVLFKIKDGRLVSRSNPPATHSFARKLAHRSALPFSTASRRTQTSQRAASRLGRLGRYTPRASRGWGRASDFGS